jgi:putative ABC transport system permease protein
MYRTALRSVLAHRARLLMTVLAVLLGVGFVAGTLVFTDSISDAYTRSSEQSFDDVDVRIRPAARGDAGTTGALLDRELLDRARALPSAGSASGRVSGFAALADRDGRLVGEGWETAGLNYGPDHSLTHGRAPRAEGEIAIDAHTAERTGYRVGDTVRMSVTGPVLRERVTGIFATDDGNVAAGGTLTLLDTATAQRLFAEPGRYNQIDLTAGPGTSPEQLRRAVARILPHGFEAVTADRLAREQADRNAQTVRALSQVLLACAGVALFVGIFLIVNTFTMLVAQRTTELALLRAVGAGRGQVTRAVLAEAALIGLVSAAAGLAVGIGAGAGVRAVLSAADATLPQGPLVVSATTVLVSLGLGLGVTLLAAWLPARRAAKIPPVAAMSSVHAPATTRSLVLRNTIGTVLAAAGAVLVVIATTMTDGKLVLGLGAVLLLTGVFVLTPLLSRPVIAAARPVLRRFGVTGTLAGQNAVRNPRRTAATAAALTIGLTLVTALTVIGAGADKATRELAATGYIHADYIVTMANTGPLAPDTEPTLREVDEVTASSPRRVTRARIGGVDQEVTAWRTGELDQLLALEFTAGSFAPGNSANDVAIVDEGTASDLDWQVGDRLDVVWPDGARGRLTLTGIYESTFDDGVKTDISTLDPHLDRIADTAVYVRTAGGANETTARELARALGDSPAIQVHNKQELVDDILGQIGLVLTILYGMLALAVVVAVLGIVNTLAMSVHERAREVGLLRAVGLDRAGVKRMIRLESLVISLFGGVLGVGLGVFLGWAVGKLAAALTGIDTWSLVLPWGRLALCLAVAALVGVLAALWPARRAARLDVLTAIKAD